MIMHGTWYKGPQLAHRTHTHSDYHRDYTPAHHIQSHHLQPHLHHHHPPPPPPPPSHSHHHTHPHQYRSYPSFVVAPYHESASSATPTPASTPIPTHATAACLNGVPAPILVEGAFAAAAAATNSTVGINQLRSVLSPTIKIEQPFGEPLSVDEYALNLDCGLDNTFRKPSNYSWPLAAVTPPTIANATATPGATITPTSTNRATNNQSTPNHISLLPSSSSATPIPPVGGLDLHAAVAGEATHSFDGTLKSPDQQQTAAVHSPSSQQQHQQHQRHSTTANHLSSQQQQQQQQQHSHALQSLHSSASTPNSPTAASAAAAAATTAAATAAATMPIGGVQGQNPTQGLVHWMSAVMAEHMTGQTHHDPTAMGMHYMWNGNVDCGQHGKEIADYNGWPSAAATRSHMSAIKQGYEAKMNDHHSNLQKGHFLDDSRLIDHHSAVTPQGNHSASMATAATIYGPSAALRAVATSNSSSPAGGAGNGVGGGGSGSLVSGAGGLGLIGSGNGNLGSSGGVGGGGLVGLGGASIGGMPHHAATAGNHMAHHHSASAAALLVVPQPINASKMNAAIGGSGGGTGRKYQCKMCPQLVNESNVIDA
ncbi:zinc finger protein rotund-like [Anastrepha obliqua]|uniref:zinc finger protein rotund-like n=1 Tax=Anastrepha obliqua TaxID=95512 RepID=UPI00240931FB|nr:zinc finger protein rotund-like [Anastrepha obliqua]